MTEPAPDNTHTNKQTNKEDSNRRINDGKGGAKREVKTPPPPLASNREPFCTSVVQEYRTLVIHTKEKKGLEKHPLLDRVYLARVL